MVSASGPPQDRVFAVGFWTSGAQVAAFARPRTNAPFFRQNDALARRLWRPLDRRARRRRGSPPDASREPSLPTEHPGPLHLAVALDGAGWHPAAWREPDARPAELFTAGYWVDLVSEAERGLLDFVTIEDALALQSADRVRPPTSAPTGCAAGWTRC